MTRFNDPILGVNSVLTLVQRLQNVDIMYSSYSKAPSIKNTDGYRHDDGGLLAKGHMNSRKNKQHLIIRIGKPFIYMYLG